MTSQIITICFGNGIEKHTRMPQTLLERTDQAVKENFFVSRSDLFRYALRFYLDYLEGRLRIDLEER